MAPAPPLMKTDNARIAAAASAAIIIAAAFAAIAAEPGGVLEDVQIGERDRTLRVALICSARCAIEPAEEGAFRLVGVAADLDVDLASRSALATRLTIRRSGPASIVKIAAERPLAEIRLIECEAESGPAPCIEYEFADDRAAAAPNGSAPLAPATAPQPPSLRDNAKGDVEAAAPTAEDIPFVGALIAAPAPHPVLRDEPQDGVVYLPQFAPPERLTPGQVPQGSTARLPVNVPVNVDVGRPAMLASDRAETLGQGPAFDFRAEAVAILGKSFETGVCEGAKARLQADAWALDAMTDVAYCKAAAGDFEGADADLSRLLAYTPDNYEALVGRGLIAFSTGERLKGQAFFQDALNALPPINESDRIVDAMARN